jgi:hypothetical protein
VRKTAATLSAKKHPTAEAISRTPPTTAIQTSQLSLGTLNLPKMSAPKVIRTSSVLPAPSLQRSWSQHLTIDTLYRVVQRTILSPFIAWIVVLCLRAQVTPPTAPAFVGAVAYAVFLSALFVAQTINHRVAHGLPRTVDSDQEVVLITGGASGLGLLIAQSYAMKGGAVAVLDIREFGGIDEQESILGEGVCYYRCDVGVRREVEDVKKRVEKEVCLQYFHFHFEINLSFTDVESRMDLF